MPTPCRGHRTAASDHLHVSYIQESFCGTDSPIQASFPEEVDDPLPAAWVDTITALGYPASGDPFSGEFRSGYVNALSADPASRTRSDAATAYFEPAKTRSNLYVAIGARVTRVVFDTSGSVPKAVGVEVEKDGNTRTFRAEKEIILSADAFGTPKLLELSGVGSRGLLEQLGIPVLVDHPNIGENLQDHPVSSISFEVNDGVKTMDALSRQEPDAVEKAMQECTTKKAGPFAVGNYTGSLLPLPDFVGPEARPTLKKVFHHPKIDERPCL
ncbi:hypothetical protein MFIFM68171_08419 [Madurella fahalii]|uniref:Glucose-methanol-choline oxidoreductase N-terminal domain-containing protein n=1 Tax=Madurella fahalii TaxID=1157608 RepID=A0ABQ0GKI9_9PEZI